MTKNHTTTRRLAPVLIAAALSVPAALAVAAPSAEAAGSSNWVCANAYSPTSGARIGKACFNGTLAQVCDLSQDGRSVYGSFSTSAGRVVFRDSNGKPSPCSYQRHNGIGSVSAWAS